MYKLEIKLKQHTPLIHFQHDQEGATLRASEVKPKLDRFIIEKVFRNNFNSCKEYLLGYSSKNEGALREKFTNNNFRALDYKMRIEAQRQNHTMYIKTLPKGDKYMADYPFVLANMGGKKNEEELINFSFNEDITLKLIVSNNVLAEEIKQILPRFFFYHNFGQRNSKGFGCFSVEKIDNIAVPEFIPSGINYFRFKCGEDRVGQDQLFEVLNYYYKRLKSGINYTRREINSQGEITYNSDPNKYKKSFLSTYIATMKEGNLSYKWDKPKIKCELRLVSAKGNGGKGSESYHPNDKCIYARALLGIPDKYEYVVKRATSQIRRERLVENETRYQVEIQSDLERMPSPILFKPYFSEKSKEVTVYLLVDPFKTQAVATVNNLKVKFIKKVNRERTFIPCDPPVETEMQIKSLFSGNPFNYNDLLDKYHAELERDFAPINFRGYLLDRSNRITIGKTR